MAAYNVYLLLKGNIYTKIVGAIAETVSDPVLNYDNSTYNNSLNSNYLGRPWWGAYVQSRSQFAVVPGNPGQVLEGAEGSPGQILNAKDDRVVTNSSPPVNVGFPSSGDIAAQTINIASAAGTQGTAPTASAAGSAPTITDNGLAAIHTAEDKDYVVAAGNYGQTPIPTLKTRSRCTWSTATGLFWAWTDEIRMLSSVPFGFASQSLPAAYP